MGSSPTRNCSTDVSSRRSANTRSAPAGSPPRCEERDGPEGRSSSRPYRPSSSPMVLGSARRCAAARLSRSAPARTFAAGASRSTRSNTWSTASASVGAPKRRFSSTKRERWAARRSHGREEGSLLHLPRWARQTLATRCSTSSGRIRSGLNPAMTVKASAHRAGNAERSPLPSWATAIAPRTRRSSVATACFLARSSSLSARATSGKKERPSRFRSAASDQRRCSQAMGPAQRSCGLRRTHRMRFGVIAGKTERRAR